MKFSKATPGGGVSEVFKGFESISYSGETTIKAAGESLFLYAIKEKSTNGCYLEFYEGETLIGQAQLFPSETYVFNHWIDPAIEIRTKRITSTAPDPSGYLYKGVV